MVSAEMEARPLDPTSLMMGVIRPVGVATATQMSARLYLKLARAAERSEARESDEPSSVARRGGGKVDRLAEPKGCRSHKGREG